MEAVWGRSATEVYAIGGQQTLLRWNGDAWSPAQHPASLPISDLWGLDSGVIFAAGYGGTVLRYDGVDWTEIPTDFSADLIAILAFAENDLYVAERFPGARIWHFDGKTWTSVDTSARTGLEAIWVSANNDVFTVVMTLTPPRRKSERTYGLVE